MGALGGMSFAARDSDMDLDSCVLVEDRWRENLGLPLLSETLTSGL